MVGSVNNLLQDNNKMNQIKNILVTAFSKGNQKMKENATECLGYLVRNLDIDNFSIFKDLADYLFKDLDKCNEKIIMKVYETLCDCRNEILNFFSDLFSITKLIKEKFF